MCWEQPWVLGDLRGLTASRAGGGQEKTVPYGGWQRAWEEMQPRNWYQHSLGRGVQGAMPVDHCPLLPSEGDFEAGTSPDAVPQGWEGETAIRLRAEKSTVGFYTNKKKYHR